jgi:hypothetical protein
MILGEETWGYFKGWLRWAVNKKMAHTGKWVPESLKTRPGEFLACAVNSRRIHEALELKSRRLSRQSRPFVPDDNQANPKGSLFRGTFVGIFVGRFWGNPYRRQGRNTST